jgi:hypothetical protein
VASCAPWTWPRTCRRVPRGREPSGTRRDRCWAGWPALLGPGGCLPGAGLWAGTDHGTGDGTKHGTWQAGAQAEACRGPGRCRRCRASRWVRIPQRGMSGQCLARVTGAGLRVRRHGGGRGWPGQWLPQWLPQWPPLACGRQGCGAGQGCRGGGPRPWRACGPAPPCHRGPVPGCGGRSRGCPGLGGGAQLLGGQPGLQDRELAAGGPYGPPNVTRPHQGPLSGGSRRQASSSPGRLGPRQATTGREGRPRSRSVLLDVEVERAEVGDLAVTDVA